MERLWKYIVLVIVTSLAACVSAIQDRCPRANETYCDATESCQAVNETCFDCCRHVNKFCESVELFGKICKGLHQICPGLGHEFPKHIISSAVPMSSRHHPPSSPLPHTISISVVKGGVVITSAPARNGSVSHVPGMSASRVGMNASHLGMSASNGGMSASNGGMSASNGGMSASNGGMSASNGGMSASNGGMSASNGGMSASHVASMSPSLAHGMSPSVAAGMSSSAVRGMSASHVAGMSSSHVPGMSASHGGMNASHVAGKSASHVAGMSASVKAGVSAKASGSMSWSSIVTSAFGNMIASVRPSSHSHVPMSSPAGHRPPWWSKHNISESMERWLNYIKNNSNCGHGKKFCSLSLKCIPDNEHCSVYLTNNMLRNLSNTAWCVNCSSDEYFCPLFMQCINVNQSCSYQNFQQWVNSNASKGLPGLTCGRNETFCFKTMKCKPMKQQQESHDKCGHDEVFCPYTASCRNKSDCTPFRALNYTEALKNDTFGWVRMCQMRNLVCPSVGLALKKCEYNKQRCNSSCPEGKKLCNNHNCIPKDQKCCPVGQKFCNKTGLCLPNGTMCCPTGQTRCKFTGVCSVPSACLPPVANVTFPTVWKYLSLGSDMSKGIFEGNEAAVALRSVKMHGVNGSLEFYKDSKWTAVNDLSASSALVLGKLSYLRFVPSRRGAHGIVLVNFTAYTNSDAASKIGKYVDASSVRWRYGKTIAIFELPSILPPDIVYNGSIYTVAEDSNDKVGFDIWGQLYDNSPKVDTDTHIPESVLGDVNRKMVELYNELLNEIKPLTLGLQIKDTQEKIKFKGGATKDYYKDKTKIEFVPRKNFNGNVTYSMQSFLASQNKSSLALAHFFSPKVAQALKMTPDLKGNLHGFGKKVLFKIMKDNLKPTSSNIRTAIQNLDGPKLNASTAQAVLDHVVRVIQSTNAPVAKSDPFTHISSNKKIIDFDQVGKVLYYGHVTRITIKVTPVNDRPVMKANRGMLEPIPYELTAGSNRGTLIKEVFDQSKANPLVEDIDDRRMALGAVILSAGNASLGRWQYKMNDSLPFEDFNLDKTKVMLLPPMARIKLKLHNNNTIWSSSQAYKGGAYIQVRVWDMSDGRKPGVHNRSVLLGTSVSEDLANLLLLRRGCDNKTNFAAKKDRCGVCRGRDRCVKCDNQPNSNATINKCGFCVGGVTGLSLNHSIDCAGQCDKNIQNNNTCNRCMNKNKIRNLKDCTGKCFGKARKDDCGNCTGGSSGYAKNYRKDSCSICGGDNTTCADCAKMPNGNSKVDFCGNCKRQDDATYNVGCAKFGALDPVSGRAGVQTKITVRGAGFKSLTLSSCEFNNTVSSQKYSATSNSHTQNTLKIEVTAPSNLPAGKYSILCTFTNNLKIESASTLFTVYNSSSISLSNISPNEAQIGKSGSKFNVTLTGSGFVDTGYLACIRVGGPRLAVGVFVSSTKAYCLITTAPKSALFNVSLVFGKNDPPIDSRVEFSFYATQPNAVSLQLQDNLGAMLLTLDKRAKRKSTNPSKCSDFFDAATLALFARDSRCRLKTSKTLLIVLSGGGAKIKPGDKANFTEGSLAAQGEANTKFVSGNKTLVVQSPTNPPVPKVKLPETKSIGPCASLDIETITENGGPRPMTFKWYVKPKPGADANTTADMKALNSTLGGLASNRSFATITKDNIVRNVEYEIVVKVTNFVGQSSEGSLRVTRKNDAVPEVELSSTGVKMQRSERLLLRARVRLPGCNGSDASGFSYEWELKDSQNKPADLGSDTDLTKSYLKLVGSNLKGGENYTLTINVFDTANPSIEAAESISVEVESSALISRIKGGVSFDVGYAGYLLLDSSESEDPDETSENAVYSWACTDSEGFDCFVNDNRVILPSTAVVNKSVASFLESGKTYNIGLTYRKGFRSAEASVQVRVQQCTPPQVIIFAQKSKKLNSGRKISVISKVKAIGYKVALKYSFVNEDGFAYESDISGLVLSPPRNVLESDRPRLSQRFGVHFKKDKLQPGKYKFKVEANTTACSSYSETEFTVNGPPLAGILTVSPSSGTALDTEFTFRAERFSDDEDDMPLSYQFGYYEVVDGEEVVSYLGFRNPQNSKKKKLAQGDENKNNAIRVFVTVCDKLGACVTVESTITVAPKVFLASDLKNLESSASALEKSGDLEDQLGTMNTVLSAVKSTSANASDDMKASLTAIKQKYTLIAATALGAVEGDKDAELNALGTMGKTTEGGAETFSDETKNTFYSVIKKLHSISEQSSRRRRRAVQNEILNVDPLTASEAETTLKPPSNLLSPNVYTLEESTRKKDFLGLVDTIGLKVCAGQGTGAPAVFAKTSQVAMRAETRNFAGIDGVTIDVACSDCTTVVKQTAKMTLGKSLEATYKSWSCSSQDSCSGACLLSTQYPEDLLLNETDSSRLTDIVDVKLYNPVTKRVVNAGTFVNPVKFLIPLKSGKVFPNESVSSVECKLWSSSEANWTTGGCVSRPSPVVSGNVTYVECNCTTLGYLSAFVGPKKVATTAPTPTPTAAPTTAGCSLEPKSAGVNVKFTLNASSSLLTNSSEKAAVQENIIKAILSTISLDECSLQDFNLTAGSIVVEFVAVPKKGQTTASLQQEITKLETKIKAGNFKVTLPGGQVVSADKNSFVSTLVTPTTIATTTAPTVSATPTESGLSDTNIIIIACVCGGVALIVIIAVTVYCCKKKRGGGKISPTPSPDPQRHSQEDLELNERGRFVQRNKDHAGANNNRGADF